jgi:hypothetical protein
LSFLSKSTANFWKPGIMSPSRCSYVLCTEIKTVSNGQKAGFFFSQTSPFSLHKLLEVWPTFVCLLI